MSFICTYLGILLAYVTLCLSNNDVSNVTSPMTLPLSRAREELQQKGEGGGKVGEEEGVEEVWEDQDDLKKNRGRISAEKLLLRRLMRRYDEVGRLGRPVHNISDHVTVLFGMGLIQMDLDEKDKIFTASMWTRYHWVDEYLRWKPSHYEGLKSIRVPQHAIWTPDIMLYNTADVEKTSRDALAVVSWNGAVSWYPQTIFRSSCSIDITNFPFDSQRCHMWFGSWTHTTPELDLVMGIPNGIDLSTFHADYKDSCGWDILNVTAQRQVMPSEEDEPNYVVLTYEIHMRRKMVFSTYILTLPCIFLACLTLVVFFLPADRPDRTSLAMSLFSSFMVLLLILIEAAPPTASSIPTLGLYYSFNMVLIMLAIILSSLVVNVSRGNTRPVYQWLSLFMRCLGRMLLVKPPVGMASRYSRRQSLLQNTSPEKTRMLNNNGLNTPSMANGFTRRHTAFCEGSPYYGDIRHKVEEMKGLLQQIAYRADSREGEASCCSFNEEWRFVSVVMDRLFSLVYVIFIIISLTLLFPRPE